MADVEIRSIMSIASKLLSVIPLRVSKVMEQLSEVWNPFYAY